MSENRRQYQTIRNALEKCYPVEPKGRLARHLNTLAGLSPVATYVYANTDIGETGVRHEQQLINDLRAYQRQFSRYVEEKERG